MGDAERRIKQKQREENELKMKTEAKQISKAKYNKLQEKIEANENMQEEQRERQINASKLAERIMEARKFERQQKAFEKKANTEKLFKIKSEKILLHQEFELN